MEAEQLAAGWSFKTRVRRDGTTESFYENAGTKQKFKNKEMLDRYLNYQRNVVPQLEEFRKYYGDGRGGYIDRPWETDPVYDINDYMWGRVGKLKEKKEMETSCITNNETVSDSEETSHWDGEEESVKDKGDGKKTK